MENATPEDRRWTWLKDIDDRDVPVFIGSIVTAINAGDVPGFSSFDEIERETIDRIIRDAEHHHRYQLLHAPGASTNGWRSESAIINEIAAVRKRLGLPVHYESVECCKIVYERYRNDERIGL